MKKKLSALICLTLWAQCLIGVPSWTAPTNNQLPLGGSEVVGQQLTQAVAFPPFNQAIQVWFDPNLNVYYYATYDGVSWSVPVNNNIPLGDSGQPITTVPSLIYDPSSSQLLLLWQDASTSIFYATYDGTGWTAPSGNIIPLGASSANITGFSLPVSFPGKLVIIWQDSADHILYYATYDGTSWSASNSNQLPLGTSAGAITLFNPVYYPPSNQVVEIWRDVDNNDVLYYATYDGTSWSTIAENQLPLGSSFGVAQAASTFYDPHSQQLLQVWGSFDDVLYYATYDGTGWSTPVSGNLIQMGNSQEVQSIANLVFDPDSNQTVLVWQNQIPGLLDNGNANNTDLYFSVYDGTSWSVPFLGNQIPLGPVSTGIFSFADPVYDSAAHQVVQIWQDNSSDFLYYATYDGTSWSTVNNNQLPLGASSGDIGSFLDPVYLNNPPQLIEIWQQNSGQFPLFFAVYEEVPLAPPASFSGQTIENKFLLQTDLIHKLSWTASPDPTVISYTLSRNGTVIYTVLLSNTPFPAGPFFYLDHNRNKNVTDVYTLTAQDSSGDVSVPLTVTF